MYCTFHPKSNNVRKEYIHMTLMSVELRFEPSVFFPTHVYLPVSPLCTLVKVSWLELFCTRCSPKYHSHASGSPLISG